MDSNDAEFNRVAIKWAERRFGAKAVTSVEFSGGTHDGCTTCGYGQSEVNVTVVLETGGQMFEELDDVAEVIRELLAVAAEPSEGFPTLP